MRIRSWSSLLALISATALLGGAAQARPHDSDRDHSDRDRGHDRDHHDDRDREGRWLAMPQGPVRLVNRARGLCLDVQGWNTRGNANVLLWDCNGDPDQTWAMEPTGALINGANGRALDVAGTAGQRGANVDVYTPERSTDQRWDLVPRGKRTFQLVNRKQKLCLDVEGTAGARGNNVLLWTCDGGADQLWSFEPAGVRPPRMTGPINRPPPVRSPPPRFEPAPRPPIVAPVVVAPAPRPMPPERFQALVRAVDHESFSGNKLTVISQAASDSLFRMEQVEQLIRRLSFSSDKLKALDVMAPKVVDRQNAFKIYDAFTFSSDKDQARKILKRHGY